ncbi:MAG: ferredoxin [Pseudomonadota bacterium]
MPTLKIDPDKCLNSGQCAYLQPELFSLADDGTPDILNAHPPDELIAKAQDAIEMCPGQAISLKE